MSSWHPTGPSDPYGQPPQGEVPGQPPYPQYGQPQHGQPQYGQPQYGQPQYGQPQYGQPQYGQPQYGQPQYGQPPYGYPGAPMPPPSSPYGHAMAPVPGGRLAGMGNRFGGLLIDSLILGAISAIIGIPMGAYHRQVTCDFVTGDCVTNYHFGTTFGLDLILLAIGIAYSAYFVGVRGQTIGHRVAGIRVVDVDSGQPIGPARGALRWFVMCVTGLICTLGYWSPFFDSLRRQGWHDKAASSVVVPAG